MTKEPNRYHTLAGAAQAAEKAGDRTRAGKYYMQFAAMTAEADSGRPELIKARGYATK
jgi:hypothetical protein